MYSDIILNIRTVLKRKKITQVEFAELINKTTQTVNNYFSERSKIDVEVLMKMAGVLDIDVRSFFDTEFSLFLSPNSLNTQHGTGNIIQQGSSHKFISEKDIKYNKQNDYLKEKVKSLEREMKLKDEIIGLLKK